MRFHHLYQPEGLNNTLLSQGCILDTAPKTGQRGRASRCLGLAQAPTTGHVLYMNSSNKAGIETLKVYLAQGHTGRKFFRKEGCCRENWKNDGFLPHYSPLEGKLQVGRDLCLWCSEIYARTQSKHCLKKFSVSGCWMSSPSALAPSGSWSTSGNSHYCAVGWGEDEKWGSEDSESSQLFRGTLLWKTEETVSVSWREWGSVGGLPVRPIKSHW